MLGAEPPARSPGFKLPAPGYVRFERPPILEACDPIQFATGETANAKLRYFDYGVVSLEIEMRFESDWPGLIALSNRWIETGEVEQRGLQSVRNSLGHVQSALRKPYTDWLDEAYYIVHLREVREGNDVPLTGPQLIAQYGREISQVIRGETQPLADGEQKEVLSASLSYYPTDLLVVGWLAAIVYDTPDGAAPLIQLLEYANTQLLEYRRYDEILTGLLTDAYAALERRGGLFSRWRLARDAENLNRLRLEVTELTERTTTALKFVGDMFTARLFKLGLQRIGVTDYQALVKEKLDTAEDLYSVMIDQFQQARGFVLEVMVVIILIIELAFLFRGSK